MTIVVFYQVGLNRDNGKENGNYYKMGLRRVIAGSRHFETGRSRKGSDSSSEVVSSLLTGCLVCVVLRTPCIASILRP